ncbi:arylamine N-acetyltransferase [Streptomyces sp. S.PB5]|uniref:arylamine N-acetyltransferase family protein n=1 Tax=Streptomyces sp. S.PB5 TaxID=3020844 RepID=UPI0025B194B0|nr:arylamine N-acetyltransferase [Streptomyces sp. S.PB5]MDN3022968.1 arylamine N-acetyltransferase [Streptomyces sp. S.PB5]
MNPAETDAYLRRLGVEHPAWPTVDVLRELQLRHLQTVPFENLSIHLGEEIVLEEKRLLDKVVGARRGGFCYELNGVFGALLTALGFDVTLLAARVYGEEGRLGIPFDHLALRVRTVDGGEWLVDVGFGAHSHHPLAAGARGEQVDPGGTFRVVEAGPDAAGVRGALDGAGGTGAGGARTGRTGAGGEGAGRTRVGGEDLNLGDLNFGDLDVADLDVLMDGKPQYRLEARPRALGDFVAGAWWHSTSPASHFTRSLVCSRVTEEGGRITLAGRSLTVTAADGTRAVRELATDEEVLGVYRERFGIVLERVPAVRSAGQLDGRQLSGG